MIREATAMRVRQNLGELLSEVQYRKGKILITKAGKPVAAIVDVALFDRIRKLDEEFEKLTRELAKRFSRVDREKGAALVNEAVRAARQKTVKR
jgi:prevent-host-death family protein